MSAAQARDAIVAARVLVIKVGSSLVTAGGAGLDAAAIDRWATLKQGRGNRYSHRSKF